MVKMAIEGHPMPELLDSVLKKFSSSNIMESSSSCIVDEGGDREEGGCSRTSSDR